MEKAFLSPATSSRRSKRDDFNCKGKAAPERAAFFFGHPLKRLKPGSNTFYPNRWHWSAHFCIVDNGRRLPQSKQINPPNTHEKQDEIAKQQSQSDWSPRVHTGDQNLEWRP
jgi:hypothetical protein